MIGVYYETWACPFASKAEDCALAKIEKPIDIVFLSFCQPNCTYKKSQGTWSGTGLNFSSDFQVIRQAIQILKQKGIKVLLSVGGASYSFDVFNHKAVAELMYDLELGGMDIDWEPSQGIAVANQFGPILEQAKQYCFPHHMLTAAVFANGVMEPRPNDKYRGVNTTGLQSHGHLLDAICIMAYDGGKELDVIASYQSYFRFQKPLLLGYQVGKQGWGDALLSLQDVEAYSSQLRPGDGFFVWAYFKQGDPNTAQVIATGAKYIKGKEAQVVAQFTYNNTLFTITAQ